MLRFFAWVAQAAYRFTVIHPAVGLESHFQFGRLRLMVLAKGFLETKSLLHHVVAAPQWTAHTQRPCSHAW